MSLLLRVVPSKELRSLPFDVPYDGRSCISDLRRLVYEHIAPANPGLTVFAVEISWRDKKLLSEHVQLGTIPFAKADSITARRFCDSFSLFSGVPGYSVDELALCCTQTIPTVEQMLAVDTRQAGMSAAERDRLHGSDKKQQQQQRRHRGSDPQPVPASSDSESFERLFSQLTPSNPGSGSLWSALVRLPVSVAYFRRLLTLDGVSVESWVRLLDANSVYRLTYSLQRISDVLSGRLPDELLRSFDNQQRLGWCEEFIKRGGLHNLINIATNTAFTTYTAQRHVAHSLYYECMELLFRLITDFFSLDPNYPTSSSIAVDGGLQRGRITQHPAFDALCHKTVMEGLVPTLLQLDQHYHEQLQAEAEAEAEAEALLDAEVVLEWPYAGHRRDMVHSALRLLSGCVGCRPVLTRDLLAHPSFGSLMTTLILQAPDEATRMQAARTAWQIVRQAAKVSVACRGQAVGALLGLLRSPVLLDRQAQCRWLFQLCLDAVDDTFHLQAQQSESFLSSLSSLGGYLLSLLRDHRSCERDDDPNVIDELLVGCLRFLTLLIRNSLLSDRESFILFVYTSCLFATANERVDGCLCKSTVSRSVAYCALLYASQQSTRCFALLTQLISGDRMWQVDRTPCGWRYEPYLLDKDEQGAPVGLRNLGSTCYINSFVQQLFMVTPFRNAVLTAPIATTAHSQTRRSGAGAGGGGGGDESVAINNSQLTPAASTSSDPPSPPSSNQSSPALPECALSRSNSTPASFLSSSAALHAAAAEAARNCVGGLSSPPPVPSSSGGLLFYLQQLFGHLQLSRKSSYDTMPLCGSLRDAEGVPINLRQQKDVNEFAGQVFDQLEVEANRAPATRPASTAATNDGSNGSGGSLSRLLSPFRGVMLNQMLSRECSHVSERDEPFYMLSVTVKHKASLAAALELLVEGELMDGDNKWQCNECAAKRTALKRCCLSALPNHLILHLKRFEFDFDAMKTIKINDRFSFPMRINMLPYTKHGVQQHDKREHKQPEPADEVEESKDDPAPSDFTAAAASDDTSVPVPSLRAASSTEDSSPALSDLDYRLSGILVHSGVADAGHYYSYVRSGSGADDDSWIELNDEIVTPFDPNNIPQAAFGGHDVGSDSSNGGIDHYQQSGTSRVAGRDAKGSMTNAYMLFYERCSPTTPEQRSSSIDSPPAAHIALAPPATDSSSAGHMTDPPPSSSAPSSPLSPTSPKRAQSGQMADSLVHRAAVVHSAATAVLSASTVGAGAENSAPGRWKYAAGGSASSTLRIDTKPPSSAHSSPLHTPSSSSSTRSSASASRPPRSLQLWLGSIPSLPPPSSLPGWLVRSIWQDNVDFVRDKQLFDFSCQSFLFHVCSRMAAATQQQRQQRMADSTQQAQIATFYVFKVLSRSAENGTFYQWMELLRQLYRISPASRVWLLGYVLHDPQFTQQTMFFCPHAVVRDAFCELLSLVVDEQCRSDSSSSAASAAAGKLSAAHAGGADASHERTQRRLSFPLDAATNAQQQSQKSQQGDKAPSPPPAIRTCAPVVTMLLSWLPVAQCAARTYSAYFRLLIRFARSRSDLRHLMVAHGAIAALVDFYTCNTAVPQFNCRVSPPVLSYIVQQQQVSAPKSLHEAYATLLASFAASTNPAAVRRLHPYHGHLAITLLALLVQHATRKARRRQHHSAKHKAVAAETAVTHLSTEDRSSLLTGLLSEPYADNERRHSRSHSYSQTQQQEQPQPRTPRNEHSDASDPDTPRSRNSDTEHQQQPLSGNRELSAGDGDGESRPSSVTAASPLSSSDSSSSLTADSASQRQQDAAPPVSPSVPATSPSSQSTAAAAAVIALSSFPFFPYVLADPSCCLSAASLTASLAANDSRLSSAVLDCVLAVLTDALQAQAHRVYGGVAVANAPLHSDSAYPPPTAQQQQQRGDVGSSIAGVQDFVGPLTALAALLSVGDRLTESRVDECLSRLLVLARRAASRRPSTVSPPGAQSINGSEERFLLQFVRCVLQLAANVKPVAAWLRAHQGEWHFLETLYTQARHLTGMQLIKSG